MIKNWGPSTSGFAKRISKNSLRDLMHDQRSWRRSDTGMFSGWHRWSEMARSLRRVSATAMWHSKVAGRHDDVSSEMGDQRVGIRTAMG